MWCYFRHGHAELLLDEDDLAAGHQAIVDINVDRLADLAVELEHRARADLEEIVDLHARAAEHGGNLDRNVEHRFEIGGHPRGRPVQLGGDRDIGLCGAAIEIGQRHLACVLTHCRFSSSAQVASARLRRALT
jgi:hypothetical protein